MPPGKFKEDGSLDIPPDVLADVLQRSIQRELILEEATTRGLELGTEYQQQLDDMYQHLTGNPLNLEGGWSIKSLNVRGSGDDADFHVRDKAARIFQDELLYQDGQSNTAATRGALRERLWSGANVVLTTPSTDPEP